mgnify:CR=1 FL=1
MEKDNGTKVLDIGQNVEPERDEQDNERSRGAIPGDDALQRPDNECADGRADAHLEGAGPGELDEEAQWPEDDGREYEYGDLLPEEGTMSRRGGLRHDKRLARKKSDVKGAKKFKSEWGKSKSLKDARRKYNRSSRKASKQQLKNYNK